MPTSHIELSGAPGDRFVDHAPGTLLESALAYAAIGWRVFPLAPRSKVPLYSNPHPAGSAMRSMCKGRAGAVTALALNGGDAVEGTLACPRDGHGCNDATTDPDVIAGWWWRTPSANIGLATGRPPGLRPERIPRFCPKCGEPEPHATEATMWCTRCTWTASREPLCSPDVVDIDVKPTRQADGTKLPAPGLDSMRRLHLAGLLNGVDAVVKTPSGGLHLYYAGSGQRNASLRGFGVDFRSWGGYVVAPPSVVTMEVPINPYPHPRPFPHPFPYPHPRPNMTELIERAYRWIRVPGMNDPTPVDWRAIHDALVPVPDRRELKPGERAAREQFHGLVEWLLEQTEGNRNSALHWAVCAALEAGADRSVVMEMESVARQLGLDEAEIRKTVASARRRADEVLRGQATG